jgi:pSer/pThr/pTyr-binding forkhead associated (FHA) protein
VAEIRITRGGVDEVLPVGDTFTIGRLDSNSLALDDEAVSRDHACVEKREGGYAVRDLDSRNGTFVERGGQVWKVEGTLGLQSGDVIRIGKTRMAFSAGAETVAGVDPNATVVGRIVPAPRRPE